MGTVKNFKKGGFSSLRNTPPPHVFRVKPPNFGKGEKLAARQSRCPKRHSGTANPLGQGQVAFYSFSASIVDNRACCIA